MHPRVATALVVGLLLLAGCAGVQFQWGSGSSPTTPTASPESTQDTSQYPPGITSAGVSEPATLSTAHATTLQGQSYSVTKTYQIEYSNGTLYTSETVSTQVAASEARYLYNSTVRGTVERIYGSSSGTLVRYANGSVVVQKTEIGAEASYRVITGPNGEPVPPAELSPEPADDRINVLFGALSNVSVTRQSGSVYRIEATSLGRNSLVVDEILISNVTDFHFTATVSADGLVRAYTVSYDGTVDGHAVSVREQREYDTIGSTTVEQPPWYENAVSNSTE